jgi:quercetin dioxygenase-like cupin family protein
MRSAITVAKETQGSDHDPNALVNPASVGRESAIESRRKEEITMDTRGFVVPPGQGPVWNMAPGRSATLKLQSGETAESVMMFEEAAPSGTVTNFHLHRDSDEVAYVLSGEVTFKIGDQVIVGGPGTCAFIPRGVAHAWKSTGAETGRVLFIFTPAEAGKAFEELQQLQCPVGSMAAPVFQRHGAEVVGPPPF